MGADAIEEQVNLYLFHTQTLMLANNERWYRALLAADIAEAEARQIIADVQAGEDVRDAA